MNQNNLGLISQLEDFKKLIDDWESMPDPLFKSKLRSQINQTLHSIKKIVGDAGCHKFLTISPPPALGGMIMRNADPFDMIFNAPYGMSMISTISDMIDQAIGILKTNPIPDKNVKTTDTVIAKYYVDPTRIQDIKTISSQDFDTTKLVKMCEELNTANSNNCYMTVAMLVRAIIDHVPPIFGYSAFREVANNYRGPKSFCDSMRHLEESMRKISDSILHTQIRNKEILPTFVQVNFSADLDVLLGEIIRMNKK